MSKAWDVANEIIDEMNIKLDVSTEGFVSQDDGCGWVETRPYSEEEKAADEAKPHSKLRNFFRSRGDAYVKKSLQVTVQKFKEENYKSLYLQTTVNNEVKSMTIQLTWLDYLRPTMFKARALIKRARYDLIEHNCLALDKHLAEIIPDRIDDILLGDGRDGKNT
jgi:hypothetical protein